MSKSKRFQGERFGRYTLIERDFSQKHPVKWICKCDCGNVKSIQVKNLKSGSTVSCGCFLKEKNSQIHKNRTLINVIGKKFNKLTVLERNLNKKHPVEWLCVCDCGNKTSVQSHALRNGLIKSCGCLQKKDFVNRITKHQKSYSSIYKIWTGMKGRCFNKKNKGFKDYGGRGITVSQEWLDFNVFYKDMGDKPENKSLDRIDNNGNYCKENCRWASPKIQSCNSRNCLKITYKGKEFNLFELYQKYSKPLGIDYSVVWRRVKRGIPLGKALKTKGVIK